MAQDFPEYWGLPQESATRFLEKMEFTALMKDRAAPEILFQILSYCLQGDAKAWLQTQVTVFRTAHPSQQNPEYAVVRAAFLARFAQARSPNELWKDLCKEKQEENQDVDQYLMQFGRLWSLWCESLFPEVPPQMIKRDRFVTGLKPTMRLKVQLKI